MSFRAELCDEAAATDDVEDVLNTLLWTKGAMIKSGSLGDLSPAVSSTGAMGEVMRAHRERPAA